MTELEHRAWLDGSLDFTVGYPDPALAPGWMRRWQAAAPEAFLSGTPSRRLAVIEGYFADMLGADHVMITPACTSALHVALRAVITPDGGEVIVPEGSYDSYEALAYPAEVRYAARSADGQADPRAIAALCGERTRAVVICSPDNPLGTVHSRRTLRQVMSLCEERRVTLVADHCLAEVSPFGACVPVVPALAAGTALEWIAIGDTGKTLPLGGTKLGALACSPLWAGPLAAAASAWYCHLPRYDLHVIAGILGDGRLPGHLAALGGQIAASMSLLETALPGCYRLRRPGAGCFCIADVSSVASDGIAFMRALRDGHGMLVVPMPYLRPEAAGEVRISLSRTSEAVAELARAMTSLARDRGLR